MTVRLPKLYPWQEEALRNWRAAGHSGVVEAVTGTGKTMVGVAAAVQVRQAGGHVLVVVPTVELLGQWRHQLRAVLPGARIGVAGHVA